MKLYYFQGKVANFGDELNPWLMPKVFPSFLDDDKDQLFLAIGSVLFDYLPIESEKIVFGSGYAGYTKLPNFDAKWRFYGVRGPRTAHACNLGQEMIIGDTAILINKHRNLSKPTGKGVSFMPHWGSLDRGHWREACTLASVKFIDPAAPVEEVLAAIEGSEVLLTEAMHGAIVADALRVPWIPMLPIHKSHRMKWYDWAESLNMDLNHYALWPSSLREAWVTLRGEAEGMGFQNAGGLIRRGVRMADWGFTRLAATRLTHLAKMPASQSADTALRRILERLEDTADRIKRDFAIM